MECVLFRIGCVLFGHRQEEEEEAHLRVCVCVCERERERETEREFVVKCISRRKLIKNSSKRERESARSVLIADSRAPARSRYATCSSSGARKLSLQHSGKQKTDAAEETIKMSERF